MNDSNLDLCCIPKQHKPSKIVSEDAQYVDIGYCPEDSRIFQVLSNIGVILLHSPPTPLHPSEKHNDQLSLRAERWTSPDENDHTLLSQG